MSLQLYQVDQKSFLLDFKSLVENDAQDAFNLHPTASLASHGSSDNGKHISVVLTITK